MDDIILKIDNVSKMYRLGQIGGTTLRDELQRWSAKLHRREDPTKVIGARTHAKNETFMALNGVSFEVKKGERVGIIGHNGAGKSTLLKLISRITAPTSGEIGLNGRVASMLEVGTGFHGELTGRENIYMNGAILGMTKKEIDSKIEQIIDFSECREFIDTPVKRYSSGMYVKLAFSVAAHLDSEIVIMDEVLAVGDMAFQKKCIDKMNQISKEEGRTILYVSHNMNTIRDLCTRCVVLNHGTVAYDGDVTNGIREYLNVRKNSVTEMNLSDKNWIDPSSVCFQSVKCLDRSGTLYHASDQMTFEICFHNKASVSDLSFRTEIRKLDNSPIATGFILHSYSAKSGEDVIKRYSLDLSMFVPGDYSTRYILSVTSPDGSDASVQIADGLQFSILQEDHSVLWQNSYWGDCVIALREEDSNRM